MYLSAFISKDIPLYLRFYVDWNDDETDLIGRFDVTIPHDIVRRFRDEVVEISVLEMQEMPSEEYYQSITV
jgi:hypothetical protein